MAGSEAFMVDALYTRGSIGKSIARGSLWTLSIKLVSRSISVVSTLILARLLMPSDFGVYALAMTVYAFIELVRAFGFGTFLIQNQDVTDDHYHTAWTMHLAFSVISAALLYACAPFAAGFLREPQLEVVLRFMCLLFLIDGVKNIGIINFQKHMTFDREFRFQIIIKLTGFFIAVPLAYILKSYSAMLFGLLGTSLMMVALSYLMQPFRPRPRIRCWREMLSFSAWLQVNNFLNYFNRHLENFMVSRMAGVAAVGSLTMAKETGQLLREIVQPINRAAFPGYARVNKDPVRLRHVFCDVMGPLAILGFSVAVGIASIAHLMVPTLLGAKWVHIVPLVRWLALATFLMVILHSTNDVLISLAKVRWATAIIALRLLLMAVLLNLLIPLHGVLGVVYATFASLSLVMIVAYGVLRVKLHLGLRRVAYILYKPALASLAMFLVVNALFPEHFVDAAFYQQLAQLLGAVLTGAVVFVLILGVLWLLESRPEGPELHLLRLVHRRTGLLGFLLPQEASPRA